MAFILSAQRDEDPTGFFDRYCRYLEDRRHEFPPNAYLLATSEWWFNVEDHRCPHDGWLNEFRVEERGEGDRQEVRSTAIRVRLLGAYHDSS